MNDQAKVRFASAEWMEASAKIWAAAAARGDFDGDEFSLCEAYTDVPPEVSATGRAAWTLRIAAGVATFVPEESDDVGSKATAAYDVLAPFARMHLDGGWPRELGEAIQDGRVQIVSDGNPLPEAMLAVHNELAAITA